MIKALQVKQELIEDIQHLSVIIEGYRNEKSQLQANRDTVIFDIGIFMMGAIDDRIIKLESEIAHYTIRLMETYFKLGKVTAQVRKAEAIIEHQRYNNRNNRRQRLLESMVGQNESRMAII